MLQYRMPVTNWLDLITFLIRAEHLIMEITKSKLGWIVCNECRLVSEMSVDTRQTLMAT